MDTLKTIVEGVEFKNPIVIASGPAGFGDEFFKYVSPKEIGAFTTKTVTSQAKDGNPPPRIVYVKDGLLNSIGLQNPGVDEFASKIAPNLPKGIVKIISIGGETPDDFSKSITKTEKFADMMEINLSCPNVRLGGIIASDGILTKEILFVCRKSTQKPLIAKLSPDLDVVEQSKIAVESGIKIVNIGNSIQGAKFNLNTGRAFLGRVGGGLSGPAFLPIILWKVYQVKEMFPSLQIIGLGGVSRPEDIIEYAIAGASLVGIGSEAMTNPMGISKLVDGVREFLKGRKMKFEDFVGISHKGGF